MWLYAWAMLGLSSSGVTEMASLTRVGLSFSTVVVTMDVFLDPCRGLSARRGRASLSVGATGFEPAASRSQSGCSTKLSYAPRCRPQQEPAMETGNDRREV